MNRLAIEAFGYEEIVVALYDDGDVIVYYIRDIADYLGHQDEHTKAKADKPKPYFHASVGVSAWGVAVHAKSRLLAISSNHHEVTVFAPALGRLSCEERTRRDAAPDYSPERSVLARRRDWRIVVRFGTGCANIPNIAFLDDQDGLAEKIVAHDIEANCWVSDIFTPETRPQRLDQHPILEPRANPHRRLMGWGVLALPESSFMVVDDRNDFFGSDEDVHVFTHGAKQERWGNTSLSIHSVQDHPEPPSRLGAGSQGSTSIITDMAEAEGGETSADEDSQDAAEESELEDDADGEGDDTSTQPIGIILATPAQIGVVVSGTDGLPGEPGFQPPFPGYLPAAYRAMRLKPVPPPDDAARDKGATRDLKDMVYTPHDAQTWRGPVTVNEQLAFFSSGKLPNTSTKPQDPEGWKDLSRRYTLLRTYEADVEMRSFQPEERSLVFKDPLNHSQWNRGLYRWSRRLNMLAHVPEIALVVAASISGRVALITPTRLRSGLGADSLEQLGLRRGFRIERVLPTKTDEAEGRGIKKPLYGIAIGPVQDGALQNNLMLRADVTESGPPSHHSGRYRLMLHYRDHSIHTYEISRDGTSLCVF